MANSSANLPVKTIKDNLNEILKQLEGLESNVALYKNVISMGKNVADFQKNVEEMQKNAKCKKNCKGLKKIDPNSVDDFLIQLLLSTSSATSPPESAPSIEDIYKIAKPSAPPLEEPLEESLEKPPAPLEPSAPSLYE
jgi:5-methylcytosine-specific restriction endonuclease McrBC GTP-binding regulatory subunit McrB